MTQKQKAWAVLLGAVAVQVMASKFVKSQAATLGLPTLAASGLVAVAGVVLG